MLGDQKTNYMSLKLLVGVSVMISTACLGMSLIKKAFYRKRSNLNIYIDDTPTTNNGDEKEDVIDLQDIELITTCSCPSLGCSTEEESNDECCIEAPELVEEHAHKTRRLNSALRNNRYGVS